MEVSMMVLRHMCEDRQMEHVHISDTNRNLVTRNEVRLLFFFFLFFKKNDKET